jgi:hypothetical protein
MSPSAKSDILESMGLSKSLILGSDFAVKGAVHLGRFKYFRLQLGYLQEQMRAWKPRTLRELFTPGYYDRGAWFIAIFGIGFGIIAFIALIISVIQLGIAIVILKLAYEQQQFGGLTQR